MQISDTDRMRRDIGSILTISLIDPSPRKFYLHMVEKSKISHMLCKFLRGGSKYGQNR